MTDNTEQDTFPITISYNFLSEMVTMAAKAEGGIGDKEILVVSKGLEFDDESQLIRVGASVYEELTPNQIN